MNRDEHDDLWQLLGKAKTPELSPFFSRDVLRRIRQEEQERFSVVEWLRRRWAVAVLGGCAFAVAVAGLFLSNDQPDQMMLIASRVSASPDYQVISHLDELLASEESAVWLDSSVY